MDTVQVEERELEETEQLADSRIRDEQEAEELRAMEAELEREARKEERMCAEAQQDAPGQWGDARAGEDEAGDARASGSCPAEGTHLQKSSEITTRELGKRGEDAAAAYLVRKGYQILERNWACRFGEVDIIAADEDGTIVFIEVKTRRSVDRGVPEEAITPEKQRRYEKIALSYMMEADWDDCVALRFDAIGICVTGDFRAMLKHHKACFNDL